MNTRWLMRASAIYLGVIGIAATFAPQELLHLAGIETTPMLALIAQISAAALVGIAMTNWMAQGVLIGGIYAKPLAVGNFAQFLISALALTKAVGAGQHAPAVIAAAAIHGIFAIAFARVAFGRPPEIKAATDA